MRGEVVENGESKRVRRDDGIPVVDLFPQEGVFVVKTFHPRRYLRKETPRLEVILSVSESGEFDGDPVKGPL